MKKFQTIAAALLLFAGNLFAQTQTTTVKGNIFSENSFNAGVREAESLSAVQFLSASDPSKVIAYTLTDMDGAFEYDLPSNANYILYYSNIGKKDVRINFSLEGNDSYSFGDILVEDDVEMLNGATITEQKTLVKMDVDKMTYKVEDDVDAQTSTVLDMLRKVPMVSVDGQDNITVNGSSNFKVYVDGKPNQMISANPSQILKFMPASSVKNIEVVTNPGVRYDAEGAGGVLNITTNAEAVASTGSSSISDGQYGSVGVNVSNKGVGGNVMYNVQKGKVSAGINANIMNQNMDGTVMDMERIQQTEAGDIVTSTHSDNSMKAPVKFVNLNANYEIDSENVVSVSAGLMSFGSTMDGTNATSITTPGGTFGYDGTSQTKNTSNSITASVDYQHSWSETPGRDFLVSYQFSSSPSINNTLNTYSGSMIGMDLTDRKADGKSNSLSHSIQADFITPISFNQSISTGVKFTYRNNSSDQTNYVWNGSIFEPTANGSLNYDFYNSIGAVYAEYNGKFGNLGVKGGLRYEYTWQDVSYAAGQGEDFSIRYGNLVPAASLQYNISNTQNIGLSYNMRVSRPGISYLNPYIDTTDPTQLSYGNTNLSTDNSHNLNLVYNLYTPKLMVNATLRYTLSPDGISQYSFMDSNNILNTTYGNIVSSSTTGLNAFIMYTPWKQTRITINGSLGYTDLSSEVLGQSNSGWTQTAMIGLQQTIPGDIRLSANLILAGGRVTLQGKSDGMSMLNLSASKSLLDNRLSLSVSGMLTKDGLSMKSTTTTTGINFTSTSSMTIPMGQIQASLTYSFGRNTGSVRKAKRVNVDDSQLNSESMGQSINSMMSGK
ncbi:MAG: TonB-dependent receptor [Bacteroidales bacterium]|nr:TonB-dependent receptor [Bacteroidales bacterium]